MDVAVANNDELLASAASCLVWIGNVYSDGNVSGVSGEVRTHSTDSVTMQKVVEAVSLEYSRWAPLVGPLVESLPHNALEQIV